MRVIGITGPTGAGKTTVLQALESLGGVLIDADAVYHDLTRSSQAMQAELIARFGPVYDGNELDRKKLGAVVFQDENALADLNRITHKYIARETQRRIEAAKAAGATAVGIDAIGLLESQLVDFCDCTLAVTAPEELRVKRIMARDGISEDYARLRVSAQKPSAWFQAHCDYTIESTEADTVETTGARAKALFEKILEVNQTMEENKKTPAQQKRDALFFSPTNGYDRLADGEEQAISPKARFYKLYSELDETEFESFLDENPDIKEQGYEGFEFDFIDDATTKGYDTGLKTRQGDPVLALDVKHGILIVEQTGEDALGLEYAGKLALCKKPENVYVGTCEGLGDYGSYVSEIVSRYDAVLGINASGFADYEGNGTGGLPYGFLKSEGTEIQGAVGNGWKIIGFDESNHLQVGEFSDTSGLRDAVEFHPALIINGQNLVAGTGLNDQQPRTAIGQAKDGTVLMLVIDGRQFHSFGISIERCGEIMGEYGAYQASMLDGGSSSVMVYKGREITSPTTLSQNEEGRTLPDAFLVK